MNESWGQVGLLKEGHYIVRYCYHICTIYSSAPEVAVLNNNNNNNNIDVPRSISPNPFLPSHPQCEHSLILSTLPDNTSHSYRHVHKTTATAPVSLLRKPALFYLLLHVRDDPSRDMLHHGVECDTYIVKFWAHSIYPLAHLSPYILYSHSYIHSRWSVPLLAHTTATSCCSH